MQSLLGIPVNRGSITCTNKINPKMCRLIALKTGSLRSKLYCNCRFELKRSDKKEKRCTINYALSTSFPRGQSCDDVTGDAFEADSDISWLARVETNKRHVGSAKRWLTCEIWWLTTNPRGDVTWLRSRRLRATFYSPLIDFCICRFVCSADFLKITSSCRVTRD